MTKFFVMRECDNILSGYLCAVTAVFSQQDGIYGFKFPKRFLEISSRDLTLLSILPDLARTLDTMPVTFAKMGLRPSFKLQYGPYVNC